MYQLERQAIFSRRWMLITHLVRFKHPGDWLRYEVAGFDFIVCKDGSGINSFRNACPHSGSSRVTETQGQSTFFTCNCHGYVYGLDGQLVKAPGRQDLEENPSKDGLLPASTHVDAKGFVWVNLSTDPEPWDIDFEGVDRQARFNDIDFSDYVFDHTWGMDGDYNWKVLADNYNECYHCKTAHPDVPALADLSAYDVDTKAGYIQHYANADPEKLESRNKIASTYYFPNASMTVTPDFFFMQRFAPSSPTTTAMQYEVYRKIGCADADFVHIDTLYKRVMAEDKWLCNLTQANLNAGVFVNGELHPHMEKGPLFFQQTIRKIMQEHQSPVSAEEPGWFGFLIGQLAF
ncbi:hypothetical protein ACHAPT_009478 [Fusarium lateritium]